LGHYFFAESDYHPMNFDIRELYKNNKDVAWCVVGSLADKTVPDRWKPPPVTPITKVFKTPASAYWQSICGRYILYPPDFDGFDIDGSETKYVNDYLLPSRDWDEYYTTSAVPGRKYNFRNRKYELN
jgi:hypothetical protein